MSRLTAQEIARGCLLRIVAQPGRYEQQTWQTVVADQVDLGDATSVEVACATTGCVAGTAAMLAGDRGIAHKGMTHMRRGTRVYDISHVITESGRKLDIRQRGQELLEISHDAANWLFSGSRTLPEVVNALIELSEGRPLSFRMDSDMTLAEQKSLMKYRVPKQIKRQYVAADGAVADRAPLHQGRS